MAPKIKGAALRKRIEERIGEEIMKKSRKKRNGATRPIMIPPIPDSKFIDKLPESVLEGLNEKEKEHQDAYKAEVKLYRTLEEMKNNFIVIHQLEFSHEQYTAFLPSHFCNKKGCKKGPKDHQCHKEAKGIEGECDIVVLGENFVAIVEVKGLCLLGDEKDTLKMQGCCESALMQRKRMKDLLQSIDLSMDVFEFTAFPNISIDQVDEQYLKNETLLFSDDLKHLMSIMQSCEEYASLLVLSKDSTEAGDKIFRCLLGLWLINVDNSWDQEHSKNDITFCIQDISEKLKNANVTRKLVDNANKPSKKGKDRNKKYPENPAFIESPQIFKDFLKVNCLTQEQYDIFECKERFLFVEGPAGSGKTIAMLGKIIDLALNTPPSSRILLIIAGDNSASMIENHMNIFRSISEDITAKEVLFGRQIYKYIEVHLDESHASLLSAVKSDNCKIVILECTSTLARGMHHVLKMFDYIFVDDYQTLTDLANINVNHSTSNFGATYKGTLISEGLFPIMRSKALHKTSLWIFCDEGQSCFEWHNVMNNMKTDAWKSSNRLKKQFLKHIFLSVNLRNTYEISSVLSIMREVNCKMDVTGTVKLHEQKGGHFLRGTKPVLYFLNGKDTGTWKSILEKELDTLIGNDSHLKNKDILVLHDKNDSNSKHINELLLFVELIQWKMNPKSAANGDKVTAAGLDTCVSAEWTAVIAINRFMRYSAGDGSPKSDAALVFPFLYCSLSRARVYAVMVVYDYQEGFCRWTDELVSVLKQRPDICTVIEG